MTKPIEAPAISADHIKLKPFRIIDGLPLDELCALPNELGEPENIEVDPRDLGTKPVFFEGDLDEGYAAMYNDEEGEREAFEWIEGTLNTKELTSEDL